MDRFAHVAELENKHRLKLPSAYRDFLCTYDGSTRYSFHGHERERWCLWSALENDWPGRHKAAFESVVANCALFEFVRHCALENAPFPAVETPGTKSVSASRLRDSITIGSENTDYLYLDASDHHSVWQFQLSDCYVQKVAPSFGAWLQRCKVYVGKYHADFEY